MRVRACVRAWDQVGHKLFGNRVLPRIGKTGTTRAPDAVAALLATAQSRKATGATNGNVLASSTSASPVALPSSPIPLPIPEVGTPPANAPTAAPAAPAASIMPCPLSADMVWAVSTARSPRSLPVLPGALGARSTVLAPDRSLAARSTCVFAAPAAGWLTGAFFEAPQPMPAGYKNGRNCNRKNCGPSLFFFCRSLINLHTVCVCNQKDRVL